LLLNLPGKTPTRSAALGARGLCPGLTISPYPTRTAGRFRWILSLAVLLATSACQFFHPSRLSEPQRRELARQFEDLIANTGASQVWIKRPARFEHGHKSDMSMQVLATSSAYPAVVSAVKQKAEKAKLEVQWVLTPLGGGRHWINLNLTRRGQPICRISIREVPHLLRAAIVIDDLGQDLEAAHQLLALRSPLTFSILPHLPHSEATAQEVHRAGREVMLHLPMQPETGVFPGQGAIRSGMSEAEVERIVDSDLLSVPFVAGVNNHMGSRATQDAALMAKVMRVLAARRLFFIDSRTTAASVALDAARRQGLPTFYRAVFLDDTRTVPYTLGQLREFRRVVSEEGVALAIGHPHPTTIEALEKFLPELERADIELVEASQVVRLPEVARLHPPAKPGS